MWVYASNGHKEGPVEFEEIVNLINSGVIVQSTPVCCSGERPCRAGNHPQLQKYFIAVDNSSAQQVALNNSSTPQIITVNPPETQVSPADPSTPPPFSPSSFSSTQIVPVPPVNPGAGTTSPGFSLQKASTSVANVKQKIKTKVSGFRKKVADSNQKKIIGIAIAVVVAIGLFFVFRGSGSSGLPFGQNKVPKTVSFSADDTVDKLLKKAEGGNLEAQFKLAMLKDIDYANQDAKKWMKKSAENGYAPAQLFYGLTAFEADENESELWVKKAAVQKYPMAIALCYAKGVEGYEQDSAKARKVLLDAAEDGDSIAQTFLGYSYLRGAPNFNIQKDLSQARYWYRQAAEQGHPDAQDQLYDVFEEKKWGYELAQKGVVAQQVNYAFNICLDYIKSPNSVEESQLNEAIAWVKQAAENDVPKAQWLVGFLYFYGDCSFPEDRDLAYKWMKKAADNGNSDAKKFLNEKY